MPLSLIPTETLVFILVDIALLVAVGILSLRGAGALPRVGSGGTVVGVVALGRGLWRALGLPGHVSFVLEHSDVAGGRAWVGLGTSIVADVCLVALGFLLAHHALAARLSGGGRSTVLKLGGAIERRRGLLAVLAFLCALFILLPLLPSGGPRVRRRRLF